MDTVISATYKVAIREFGILRDVIIKNESIIFQVTRGEFAKEVQHCKEREERIKNALKKENIPFEEVHLENFFYVKWQIKKSFFSNFFPISLKRIIKKELKRIDLKVIFTEEVDDNTFISKVLNAFDRQMVDDHEKIGTLTSIRKSYGFS